MPTAITSNREYYTRKRHRTGIVGAISLAASSTVPILGEDGWGPKYCERRVPSRVYVIRMECVCRVSLPPPPGFGAVLEGVAMIDFG